MIRITQHVVLVGGSGGRDRARAYVSDRSSIWCVARIYDKVPYANYVFEMHNAPSQWTKRTHKAYEDGKLVLRQPLPSFPDAEILPTAALRGEFGDLFTSSFAWIMAYAIYAGAEIISLVGINMMHVSEQGQQRDGMLYLLGFAKARGIQLDIPQQSRLKQGVHI